MQIILILKIMEESLILYWLQTLLWHRILLLLSQEVCILSYRVLKYTLYSTGPGSQPSTVVASGANVSSVITFTARGSRSVPLTPFDITDDSFALETVESYQLSVRAMQPNPSVNTGSPTTVMIVDDEGKCTVYNCTVCVILFCCYKTFIVYFLVLRVTFGRGSYNATEGDSNRMLQVMINHPIVQDFTVTVNGSQS